MADLRNLDQKEKMFLAGCIKSMILAEGTIKDEELNDLEKITEELQFNDFNDSLTQFEDKIHDKESFWTLAKEIVREETIDLIIKILYEMSIQDGYTFPNEKALIDGLRSIWEKPL